MFPLLKALALANVSAVYLPLLNEFSIVRPSVSKVWLVNNISVAETSLDQYTFYNQSVYNNELVDDGEGGQEARFAINVNITQQSEAFDLINNLCSVMRVMPFYSAGGI